MSSRIYREIATNAGPVSSSSLQIPRELDAYFKLRCKELGSRRAYFQFLAQVYLPHLRLMMTEVGKQRLEKWKTTYQAAGQDLQKRNFEPRAWDWEFFRHAAGAAGVSICFLFVFLMKLEKSGQIPRPPKKNHPQEWNTALKSDKKMDLREFRVYFERYLFTDRGKLLRKVKLR